MSIEKLFDQIGHDLGWHDYNMRRDRPYNGQPHTDTGIRGATEIKGITFRDLRDCFVRAVLLSTGAMVIDGVDMRSRYEEACKGENATLCENDLFGFNLDKLDPVAISQNLSCEVEKMMGIFPNVPSLRTEDKPRKALLELAAKAAGIFLTPEKFAAECTSAWEDGMSPFYDERRKCMTGYRTWYGKDGEIGGLEAFYWNPLTDDGDALRLAVKLKLIVSVNDRYCMAGNGNGSIYETEFSDPYAATRRAITRAAAEIGKALEE